MKYSEKIPLDSVYVKNIIDAISNAYFLYKEHVNEQNFPTDNGREGEIWNYINKCIMESLPTDRFQIVVMNRGRWKFLGIYDKAHKYLYTLMREKNLDNIRKTIDNHLYHYVNALSKLNDGLAETYETEYHQMSIFGVGEYDDQGEEILEKILTSMIQKIDGEIERYVLISFNADYWGNVTDIKGMIPSKGLDYYKEESWNYYSSVEYSEGTETTQESEVPENTIMLQRKPRIKRIDKEKNDRKEQNG